MEILSTRYRTDACGRSHGPYRTILLDEKEWEDMAKKHEVRKPHVVDTYELGCGWDHAVYEMAIVVWKDTYFKKGHNKRLESRQTETMNEFNS